jgi:iron complex outermembrane recepter protein
MNPFSQKHGPRLPGRRSAYASALACTLALSTAVAQAQRAPSLQELKTLSLEELGEVRVTSVSKAEEALSQAAAAVAVVTNQDIRRSGATTLPEALRLVPGIHVARQTSNTWAVSSRGFSSTNSEKLLVLSDTRSVYTPLYAGVFWDAQDVLLEDVDRIEVIRGPGAALWGSNAVNGVINVTTKSSRDTQGFQATLHGGTEDKLGLGARYGGRVGKGHFRVYGKYSDRSTSFTTATIQRDDWQIGLGGVRLDLDTSARSDLTLQGEVYAGDVGRLTPSAAIMGRPGPTGLLRTHTGGGHVLARWSHRPSARSDVQVRAYYDRTHRNDPSFVDDLHTIDLDLQHRSSLGHRHEVTWGANYRFTSNHNESKVIFALDPPQSRDHVVSGFLQHQTQLGDSLRLTTGVKLEHNDFSGAEVQPSVRASWSMSRAQTLWGAVSRATRTPTRIERDIAIDIVSTDVAATRLLGNDDFDSERLVAFEAGYRWQHSTSLAVDVAAYHNRYRGLASLEVDSAFTSGGRTITPYVSKNLTDGDARGLEWTLTVAPTAKWRVATTAAGTWLDLTAHGQDANLGVSFEGSTPRYQVGLRSSWDLGQGLEVDVQSRHSAAIRRLPNSRGKGPRAYTEADIRLGWQAARYVELSLTGQNLLHAHHAEFGAASARGEIQRGVYASIAWRR